MSFKRCVKNVLNNCKAQKLPQALYILFLLKHFLGSVALKALCIGTLLVEEFCSALLRKFIFVIK